MHEAFEEPEPILEAPSAVSALLISGRRLYVALATAGLSSYLLPAEAGSQASLETTAAALPTKKAIEQLGFIKELNSLVALSDGTVLLLDSHSLKVQISLQQTKSQANIFAINSSVQTQANNRPDAGTPGIPVVLTSLVVACRRRLVVFCWQDSQWVEPQEVALPHQVRSLTFANPSTILLGYSDATYGRLSLTLLQKAAPLQVEEFSLPENILRPPAQLNPPSEKGGLGSMGLGSLGGLALKTGGYMGIGGMGRVARNQVLSTGKGEVLIMRDTTAILATSDGSADKSRSIEFSSEPLDIVICASYIVALLHYPEQRHRAKAFTLVVHSLTSLSLVYELTLAASEEPGSVPSLLLSSVGAKAPLAYVQSSGSSSTVYLLRMPPWAQQLDQMVQNGSYEDALPLLESVEDVLLPDKAQRRNQLKALSALSRFFRGEYDAAIDVFIDLDLNPAKVICLYPERVSGKLYKDELHREAIFGGRKPSSIASQATDGPEKVAPDNASLHQADTPVAASPAQTHRKWPGMPYRNSVRDDDTASVRSTSSNPAHARQSSGRETPIKASIPEGDRELKRSVEVLLRYLADRRQQVNKAVSALKPAVRPSPSTAIDLGTVDELFDIPDGSYLVLKPLQLHRVAQIVDTALFRCYLAIRPTLLGPLCRLENWCVVEEVEALLKEANKYRELLDLYRGRKNHSKSLELLRTISESADSPDDKVASTVDYLQKLGPNHLDLIFSAVEWVFATNRPSGLQVFTADLEEVENLPRHAVLLFLEKVGPDVCQAYLEHIINGMGEDGPEFHEKLIELYLAQVRASKDNAEREPLYKKLLDFLQTSSQYRADRVLGRLPNNEVYEARAILLGRLGQHQAALQIYVTRLQDYATAEEYCKRVYATEASDQTGVFSILLKIYLKPASEQETLLGPALQLLARHGTRINADSALGLLPPLITVKELDRFLYDAVTHQAEAAHGAKLQREVYRARLDRLQQAEVLLRSQYVRVSDSRTCPLCHKRIGNSVIAIHLPDGSVTHYRCRTRFGET